MTSDMAERDTSAIAADDWPMREPGPLTGLREARFQVVYRQSVLDQIHLHGQSARDIEVCGVLVGTGCRDQHGPYLLIEHIIHGSAAASRSTNVTFTADTWQHIQETMDREHADRRIVGWYHTHPGFGIFLSEMDVFICDNFFNLPWQSAFVYDPHSGEEGNFVWRGGKPEREEVLIENDVTPASAQIPLISKQEAMAAAEPIASSTPMDEPAPPRTDPAMDHRVIELMQRVRRLEIRQRWLIVAIVFLIAFVAFWAMQSAPPAGAARHGMRPTTQLTIQLPGPSSTSPTPAKE